MTQELDDLLATKLEIPQLASHIVRRSRLTEILQSGLSTRVSLVIAPAGYGKTTLLGEWILNRLPPGWRVAWVSLDGYDNDLARFWSYVIGAIRKGSPGLKPLTPPISLGGPAPFTFLDPFLNELAANSTNFCLVLDDYHLIQNDSIHQSIRYFIEHQPKNFHLVLSSRAKPPIHLSRMRAQGQLVEITDRDLSFTPQEVNVFLNKVMDLAYGADQTAALTSATEGWIAGLKLAALSLHDQQDFPQRLIDLQGVHPQIFEFLVEEVLNQQGEEIKSFLLNTSPLSEFSAPLCDAVLERSDSLTLIDCILQKNLFLVPLDNQRIWFRYHHLFSDTLRTHLNRIAPQQVRDIQKKASRWMQDNGHPDQAVSYALDAGDLENAARIIDACALKAVTHYNVSRLISWVSRLSPDLLEERPQLGVYVALAYHLLGKPEETFSQLELVEQSLRQNPDRERQNTQKSFIAWQIAAMKAIHTCLSDRLPEGIAQVEALIQNTPPEDPYMRGNMTHILAESYTVIGQLDQALVEFRNGMTFATQHQLRYEFAYSLTGHAQVLKLQGRLEEAAADYQQMLAYTRSRDLNPIFHAYALTGAGEILLEKYRIDACRPYFEAVKTHLQNLEQVPAIWLRMEFILCRMAKYEFLSGDPAQARRYFSQALKGFHESPSGVPFLAADLMDMAVRLAVADESALLDPDGLLQELSTLNEFHRANIAEKMAIARLNLAQNQFNHAAALLQEILAQALQSGQRERAIEAELLLARCHAAEGLEDTARKYLITAVNTAAIESHLRLFIEEQASLSSLLAELSMESPSALLSMNSLRFLQQVNQGIQANTPPPLPTAEAHLEAMTRFIPYERLSSREEEVIRLLKTGLSTKEIACELVISVNTTKTHLQSVYRKLGVHTKEEALRLLEHSA
jgi:LuxR family maltose regulon positive regulatory protein